MITVEVHKDKLRQAAFEWQQRKLKAIGVLQDEQIDKEMARWWFPAKTRFAADKKLCNNMWYGSLKWMAHDVTQEYLEIQAACAVAEEYVTVDAKTLQKLFPE